MDVFIIACDTSCMEAEIIACYLLPYLLHGAESFLRSNWFLASQEIPRI
jgi:hypothetical protein